MSTSEHSPLAEPVVVGVDGSASSLTAVDLAAREAALRRRPLRLVHAFNAVLVGSGTILHAAAVGRAIRWSAE